MIKLKNFKNVTIIIHNESTIKKATTKKPHTFYIFTLMLDCWPLQRRKSIFLI